MLAELLFAVNLHSLLMATPDEPDNCVILSSKEVVRVNRHDDVAWLGPSNNVHVGFPRRLLDLPKFREHLQEIPDVALKKTFILARRARPSDIVVMIDLDFLLLVSMTKSSGLSGMARRSEYGFAGKRSYTALCILLFRTWVRC